MKKNKIGLGILLAAGLMGVASCGKETTTATEAGITENPGSDWKDVSADVYAKDVSEFEASLENWYEKTGSSIRTITTVKNRTYAVENGTRTESYTEVYDLESKNCSITMNRTEGTDSFKASIFVVGNNDAYTAYFKLEAQNWIYDYEESYDMEKDIATQKALTTTGTYYVKADLVNWPLDSDVMEEKICSLHYDPFTCFPADVRDPNWSNKYATYYQNTAGDTIAWLSTTSSVYEKKYGVYANSSELITKKETKVSKSQVITDEIETYAINQDEVQATALDGCMEAPAIEDSNPLLYMEEYTTVYLRWAVANKK